METDLLKAAFTRVKSIADGLGLPCYWPNVAPQSAPADVHLRVSVLPTSPRKLTVCGGSQWQWILQITVWVRDGVGVIAPAQHVDSIRGAIPFGDTLTGNSHSFKTVTAGEAIPPIPSNGWFAMPVQFRFMTVN